MKRRFDREKLKAFIIRRKVNFFGLLAITAVSALSTLALWLMHSPRTRILVAVTVLLMLLCALQAYRMRSSYRTMPDFRGFRKKRKQKAATD